MTVVSPKFMRVYDARRLKTALRAVAPPLLFGFRLWASVCLALYVAFWLKLDNAFWAGYTAVTVSQPRLGASLRKGWFRMVGTVVGATAVVALTGWFPQDRGPFLIGLALWGAGCTLVATLLKNFAAYAAALAGYTVAIIASDELGATGGPDGGAFMFAITRASEICIGIVSAGVILAATDFGGARRRLATLFSGISSEISGRFTRTLAMAETDFDDTQRVRRELARRVIALDPIIDEAFGESSQLRYHSPVLQAAVDGLFAALSSWRAVSVHLRSLSAARAQRGAHAVLERVPEELRSATENGGLGSGSGTGPARWIADPVGLRRICDRAARRLIALPAASPSLRLLADQTAEALAGISHALNGLALLVADFPRPTPRRGRVRLRVPDWLPALVNAGRAFVVIGAAELFWIVTAWPNGASAVAWAAIGVILLALRADHAYDAAIVYMLGTGLAVAFAALVKFAVLPQVVTYFGFSIIIGLYLVPTGALIAQPRHPALFTAMAANFVPLLAPTNEMNYDTEQFYNGALAIVAGLTAATLSFRLIPPLSPAFRSRRLLALTLRDLRRLATGPIPRTPADWEGHMYGRLSALPDRAEPLQRAQLLAALSVGTKIIQLRRVTQRLNLQSELDAALESIAWGDSAAAVSRLAALDKTLATRPGAAVLRARGRILAMSEALGQHTIYFDARGFR
jgi:uncharacterized membrane protein YccC